MKILMLTDLTYPSDHSFLEEVFIKRFTNKGHIINWVMRINEKNKESLKSKNNLWGKTIVHLVNSKGVRSLKNSCLTALYTLLEVPKIIEQTDWDIIQVRNDPMMGLIALWKAKRKNKKMVFQYTFYKSKVYRDRSKSINNLMKGFVGGKIEAILVNNCDLILPISKTMANELVESGLKPNRILPCTLGVDEGFSQVSLHEVDLIREKFDLLEDVVMYLGTLDRARDLGFLIRVFSQVKERRPNAQLLLVGDATNQDDIIFLKRKAEEKGLSEKDVIFTGRVPRRNIYQYLAASSVCVSPIPPLPIYRVASPIKLMDYLNSSKPVVCNKGIIEQEKIIEESQAGICVDYDINQFANAIIDLLQNPDERKAMGTKGKEYIIKNYSYTSIAEKLEKAYEDLLEDSI